MRNGQILALLLTFSSVVGCGSSGDGDMSPNPGTTSGACSPVCLTLDGQARTIVSPNASPSVAMTLSVVHMRQWQLGAKRTGMGDLKAGEAFILATLLSTKDYAAADFAASDIANASLSITHTEGTTNAYHQLKVEKPAADATAGFTASVKDGKIAFTLKGDAVNEGDGTTVKADFTANALLLGK